MLCTAKDTQACVVVGRAGSRRSWTTCKVVRNHGTPQVSVPCCPAIAHEHEHPCNTCPMHVGWGSALWRAAYPSQLQHWHVHDLQSLANTTLILQEQTVIQIDQQLTPTRAASCCMLLKPSVCVWGGGDRKKNLQSDTLCELPMHPPAAHILHHSMHALEGAQPLHTNMRTRAAPAPACQGRGRDSGVADPLLMQRSHEKEL
jgi:hypothetical protein